MEGKSLKGKARSEILQLGEGPYGRKSDMCRPKDAVAKKISNLSTKGRTSQGKPTIRTKVT